MKPSNPMVPQVTWSVSLLEQFKQCYAISPDSLKFDGSGQLLQHYGQELKRLLYYDDKSVCYQTSLKRFRADLHSKGMTKQALQDYIIAIVAQYEGGGSDASQSVPYAYGLPFRVPGDFIHRAAQCLGEHEDGQYPTRYTKKVSPEDFRFDPKRKVATLEMNYTFTRQPDKVVKQAVEITAQATLEIDQDLLQTHWQQASLQLCSPDLDLSLRVLQRTLQVVSRTTKGQNASYSLMLCVNILQSYFALNENGQRDQDRVAVWQLLKQVMAQYPKSFLGVELPEISKVEMQRHSAIQQRFSPALSVRLREALPKTWRQWRKSMTLTQRLGEFFKRFIGRATKPVKAEKHLASVSDCAQHLLQTVYEKVSSDKGSFPKEVFDILNHLREQSSSRSERSVLTAYRVALEFLRDLAAHKPLNEQSREKLKTRYRYLNLTVLHGNQRVSLLQCLDFLPQQSVVTPPTSVSRVSSGELASHRRLHRVHSDPGLSQKYSQSYSRFHYASGSETRSVGDGVFDGRTGYSRTNSAELSGSLDLDQVVDATDSP